MDFKEATQFLGDFKNWKIARNDYHPFIQDINVALSPQRLMEIKKEDLEHARDLKLNDNRYTFKKTKKLAPLLKQVKEYIGEDCFCSGQFWYPWGGYCGWHTNNDAPGERIYLVWAAEENKSCFRFQDPATEEIITNWDTKGWSIKRFNIDPQKTLWHCVGSMTNRVSIGFRPGIWLDTFQRENPETYQQMKLENLESLNEYAESVQAP